MPSLSGRLVQRLKYGTCWHIDSAFVVVDVHKDGVSIMLGAKPETEALIAEYKRRKLECRRQAARRNGGVTANSDGERT
jgi:hypothetical protein